MHLRRLHLILQAGRLVVLVKIGFKGKRLVAAFTREMFEGRVGLHVSSEVGAIGERLAAVSASVRLLSRVGTEVTLEQPGPGKGLPTDVARMFEVVGEDVHGQCWHADVHLVAVGTFLGLLAVQAAVGLLVTGQVGRRGVMLPTLATRVAGSLGRLLRNPQRIPTSGSTIADKERVVCIRHSHAVLEPMAFSTSGAAASGFDAVAGAAWTVGTARGRRRSILVWIGDVDLRLPHGCHGSQVIRGCPRGLEIRWGGPWEMERHRVVEWHCGNHIVDITWGKKQRKNMSINRITYSGKEGISACQSTPPLVLHSLTTPNVAIINAGFVAMVFARSFAVESAWRVTSEFVNNLILHRALAVSGHVQTKILINEQFI